MADVLLTILIAAFALFFILVGLAKFNSGIDDSWRQQIADHGCAEFYLDAKHERQWRWK